MLTDRQRKLIALVILRRRRERKEWVHSINEKRTSYGEFHHLFNELRQDTCRFYKYFRMTPDIFDDLLKQVNPLIRRKDTNYRTAISSSERLAITLR